MTEPTGEPPDESVLDPDELGLDDERVRRLAENRYLIEAGDGEQGTLLEPPADLDAGLSTASERYVIEIAAKTDETLDRTRVASDDIREVFAGLLRWYAGCIDPDAPPDEVLELLFEASDVTVATHARRTDGSNDPKR